MGASEEKDGGFLSPFSSFSSVSQGAKASTMSMQSDKSLGGNLQSGDRDVDAEQSQPWAARMSARQSEFLNRSVAIPLTHVMKFASSLLEAAVVCVEAPARPFWQPLC